MTCHRAVCITCPEHSIDMVRFADRQAQLESRNVPRGVGPQGIGLFV